MTLKTVSHNGGISKTATHEDLANALRVFTAQVSQDAIGKSKRSARERRLNFRKAINDPERGNSQFYKAAKQRQTTTYLSFAHQR